MDIHSLLKKPVAMMTGEELVALQTEVIGDFGDIDHPIPDQTDHRFRRKLTM